MAQQTPYIGSKISLISKLDIRYEGILYTVDSQEATIALSKVKSFGTEDRPTPHPVPGRDEVYEYIIFKASDIKDLIVCDAPKPPPAMGGLPYDPAILSVSEVPKAQDHVQTSHSGTPRESPPLPIGSQAPSRAPGAGRPSNEGLPPQQPPRRGGFHPPQQQQQQYRPQRQEGGRGYHHQQGGYNNQHQPHQHYYNQNRGAGGHRGQQQHGRPPMRANQPREKLKFDSDFDFEKANEQFIGNVAKDLETKLNISESEKSSTPRDEPLEEEIPEDDHEKFYDKTSSFFDSISCEALEKQEGKNTRPDWRKERMTNQETFGQNAIRSLGYRRGGGGRGYGGQRGGQRGGGYGGNQRYNNGYSNYGGNRTYTSSNNRRNNATRGSATAGADF